MANRVTVPVTNFESLSPPWSLASLDQDLLALQGAINDSSVGYVISGLDTGSANNYVVTPTLGVPSAYQSGMTVAFFPAHSNTSTSCTLSVGALSPQPLQFAGVSNAVPIGWINQGQAILATYIGTGFQLLSGGSGALPLTSVSVNPGTSLTVNCRSASVINVFVQWTIASSVTTINLTNVSQGVPIALVVSNGSAGTITWGLNATDPSSTAITVSTSFPTGILGAGLLSLSSQTLNPGCVLSLFGMVNSGVIYFNN